MIDVIESVVLLLLLVVCSRNSKRMIKIVRRCIMVMIVMIMFCYGDNERKNDGCGTDDDAVAV